jgi:hypothetical protein
VEGGEGEAEIAEEEVPGDVAEAAPWAGEEGLVPAGFASGAEGERRRERRTARGKSFVRGRLGTPAAGEGGARPALTRRGKRGKRVKVRVGVGAAGEGAGSRRMDSTPQLLSFRSGVVSGRWGEAVEEEEGTEQGSERRAEEDVDQDSSESEPLVEEGAGEDPWTEKEAAQLNRALPKPEGDAWAETIRRIGGGGSQGTGRRLWHGTEGV